MATRTTTLPPQRQETLSAPIFGLVIGCLVGVGSQGEPFVDYPGRAEGPPLVARSATPLTTSDRGRAVALLFEDGDPDRPIVIGLMHDPAPGVQVAVSRADERIVLRAEREIVLECGEASITLTRAGKVLIRGTYVLSRSTGANLVKGGVVHLN